MEKEALYIQVENGEPVNHPAYASNLIDAFGEIPSNWELFLRVQNPTLTDKSLILEKPDPEYHKVDGVWTDVWIYRTKNEEDLAEEQRKLKEIKIRLKKQNIKLIPYANNFTAWVLNEETLQWEPPFPKPDDGKFYRWNGAENNWKEAEPFPDDGKKYYFDFDNWINVESTDE